MWKLIAPYMLERPCPHCAGKGLERLYISGRLCCNWETFEEVAHPENVTPGQNDYTGIRKALARCKTCGRFWLVWRDNTDESIDVPAPCEIGYEYPEHLE